MISDVIPQQVNHIIKTNENWRRNYGCIGERTIIMTFNYHAYLVYHSRLFDVEITRMFINHFLDIWELCPNEEEIRGNDEIEKLRGLMSAVRLAPEPDRDSALWPGLARTYACVDDYLDHLSGTTMLRDVTRIIHVWLDVRARLATETAKSA